LSVSSTDRLSGLDVIPTQVPYLYPVGARGARPKSSLRYPLDGLDGLDGLKLVGIGWNWLELVWMGWIGRAQRAPTLK